MEHLGRHLLAELYGCEYDRINNLTHVEDVMKEATIIAGAHMVNSLFHKFGAQGVSGVVIIAESYFGFHSWPELGFVSLDLYSCGETVDNQKALAFLIRKFGAQKYSASELLRGDKREMIK